MSKLLEITKTQLSTKFMMSLLFLGILSYFGCSTHDEKVIHSGELTPGEWYFKGHLGDYIDTIAVHRILDKKSWKTIYPETEEAFAIKTDDKHYPVAGKWRGEFWGKYILSAIAASKYYHSDELKNRIAQAVKGLQAYQEKDGYLGTYKHSGFVIGNNWNVWSQKYTLWGLIESYRLLKDREILETAKKLTDHLISEVGPGKTDMIKTGNFYGMPSTSILFPVVNLYIETGEKRYLDYAEYIVEQWGKHPEGLPDILNKGLTGKPVNSWFRNVDSYKWAKGYEFTSCVEGLAELYRVTGNETYFKAAKNIHEVLVKYERTNVSSVSFDDKFVGSAGLINTVSEICDVVYWNRLSFKLFTLTGDSKYIEEMERALYNSLLCAFNRDGNWGLRRLRTSHIHVPATNHFLQHHQCCTDNLPRGLFQAAEVVLMKKNENEIFLSLFNQGEGFISLHNQKINFKTEGNFIDESMVKTTISVDKPLSFQLNIRVPGWSNNILVKINGKKTEQKIINNYLALNREWNNGDKLKIEFFIQPRWETFIPSLFDSTFHKIDFYNNVWANIKYATSTNLTLNEKYGHPFPLNKSDALPQKRAITFFYGPLALSRDIRISDNDIFSTIPEPEITDSVVIKPIKHPASIWKSYEIKIGNKQTLRFCDFSSAGNTWDKNSLFNTWCIVKK